MKRPAQRPLLKPLAESSRRPARNERGGAELQSCERIASSPNVHGSQPSFPVTHVCLSFHDAAQRWANETTTARANRSKNTRPNRYSPRACSLSIKTMH